MRLFSDGTSVIFSLLSTVLKYSAFPHSLKSFVYEEPVCEKRSHNCGQGSFFPMYSKYYLSLCLYFQAWHQLREVGGEEAQLSPSEYPLSSGVRLKFLQELILLFRLFRWEPFGKNMWISQSNSSYFSVLLNSVFYLGTLISCVLASSVVLISKK